MKKEMLINVLQSEECRIAIVEDGLLEELYVERSSQESYVGNIYKGRIVNIEPSIQAAFVDFGIGRNGFLHVSDVDPAYYKHLLSKEDLAEYEAELDREYGSNTRRAPERGDRGERGPRDRGPRQPKPMTSWLEPQSTPTPPPREEAVRSESREEPEGFASGLDEIPIAEEIIEEVVAESTRETPVEPSPVVIAKPETSEPEDIDQEFGAGLIEGRSAPQEEAIAPIAPRPQPVRTSRVEAPKKSSHTESTDDDDFGAGIVEQAGSAESIKEWIDTNDEQAPALGQPFLDEPDPETAEPTLEKIDDSGDALETAEPVEDELKSKKARTRKPKAKTEEAAESGEASEQSADPKGKAKTRRNRKKGDEGDNAEGDSGDDKPRYMGGAERRTSADDDEPEIAPFFEDSGGFDPDAPNDRFTSEPGGRFEEEEREPAAEETEPTEDAGEEFREVANGEDRPEVLNLATGERPEPVEVGRGFNDDFDSGPPRRDRDRDKDRGRGRSRGRSDNRGGRDRDRDRDRGPRGGGGGFKGGPKAGRDRGIPKPKIEDIFKRGQEVLVQVIKEAVGTKGPTLSTYISIAGRYLVLMPSLNRVGVSRKIEDHEARRRLRDIMNTLTPPKGVGFIVRTAAVDRDAKELRNDLAYLLRLWQVVVKRIKRVAGPVEIYRESDMITRTIRDIFTNDIDTIWVDEANAFAHASEFLQIVMPKFASRIRYFESSEPLFHKYGVENEIAKIHQKRIEMPLGGSLVIEQTEALVAIDVNSGNFRADNNAEETAFQMNLHAAKEIARQLRLRDLGGVIVNDFIDMRSETHRRKVEDALRDALRRDRARTKILRISQFGLIEMTRQRIRPSLKRSIFSDCSHCRGTGYVKTSESLSIDAMRLLQLAAHRTPSIASVQVGVHIDVAHYLLNKRRKDLAGLEERGKMEIQVTGQAGVSPDTLTIRCFDHNGNEVRLLPPPPLPRPIVGRFPGRNERHDKRYPQPLD
jgi:ribonuclease E